MIFKNKLLLIPALSIGLMANSIMVHAERYTMDTEHTFIQFKVQHLGYSWLHGNFNNFSGTFYYDENNPEKSSAELTIKTNSIDSNHAERDKHLRSDDFLNVDKFPEAKFISTKYIPGKEGKGTLRGDFTLHGVTKEIDIEIEHFGAGDDPWGGFRRGFEGKTKFRMADFGLVYDLGVKSKDVELSFSIEGIREKKQ